MSRVLYLCALFTLFLCVTVDGGLIQVRVNRVFVQSVFEAAGWPRAATTDYRYEVGDNLDLWCISAGMDCALRLTYDFSDDAVGGHGSVADNCTSSSSSSRLLGLRTTLRAAHHGRLISCECTSAAAAVNYTIEVKLVLATFDHILDVKIGSSWLRYQQPSLVRLGGFAVSYAYTLNERFTLSTASDVPHALLETYQNNQLVAGAAGRQMDVKPDDVIRNVVRNESTALRTVTVVFNYNFTDDLYDATPLRVNASSSSLELYAHCGDRRIYYDYQDGEALTLECSTAAGLVTTLGYRLVFGDIVERGNDSIIKEMLLSAANDNQTVDCSLMRDSDNATVRKVHILFRMRSADAPTADALSRLVTPVGAALCALLALAACAVLAVRCSQRRRSFTLKKQASERGVQETAMTTLM